MNHIERIKTNPLATKVKIADLQHNMTLSRLNSISEHEIKRLAKYEKAIRQLNDYPLPQGKCTRNAYQLDCCNIIVPSYYRFCPKCGKRLDIDSLRIDVAEFDLDETMWICQCGHAELLKYRFCGYCGKSMKGN